MTQVIDQVAGHSAADRSAAVETYIAVLSRERPEPGDAELLRDSIEALGWNLERARDDAQVFAAIAAARADEARVSALHKAAADACVAHGEAERSLEAEAVELKRRTEETLARTLRDWNNAQAEYTRAAASAGRLATLRGNVEAIRAAADS